MFAPWSVRALDHAPVSCPFPWELLATLRPHDLTIADRARSGSPSTATRGRRWTTQPQSLEPFLEMVRRDQAAGLLDAPWPPVYPKMAGEPPRVAPSRAKKPKPEKAEK